MTALGAIQNALTFLEALGYKAGGDVHDDLAEAIQVLKVHREGTWTLYSRSYSWRVYIPEEGHWDIEGYNGPDIREARKLYLKWSGRKRLPPGAKLQVRKDREDTFPPK